MPYINIKTLIKQAEDLKSVDYDSPEILFWKKRADKFILANYDPEFKHFLTRALSSGPIKSKTHGQEVHIKAMTKAIIVLENLKSESKLSKKEKTKIIISNKIPSSLDLIALHPMILRKCRSLFEKAEYSEAVEKSFKVVKDKLRNLTSYEKGSEAFGKAKLHIKGASAKHVDNDFNEGVKFLTMAIDMFKNEKGHTSDAKIDDPQRAYEYLTLSSLAMNLLDQGEILSSKKTGKNN